MNGSQSEFMIDSKSYLDECVVYLEDAPDAITRFLNNSRFADAAIMFMRAKHIFKFVQNSNRNITSDLYWEAVEEKKSDISELSRKWLFSGLGKIAAVAHALSAIAIIDNLNSVNLLSLFLESRKSFVSQILCHCLNPNLDQVISVFCKVFEIIQLTFTHAGHLFMHLPSTSTSTTSIIPFPLLNNTLLACGRKGIPIPDPQEEFRFLQVFTIKLKGSLIMLNQSFISGLCSTWLWDNCKKLIISPVNGFYLVDVMENGHQLIAAENKIRETMQGKKLLRQSLVWLKTVFGASKVEVPWKKTSQLFLEHHIDLWTEVLEYHFMERMNDILESRFMELTKSLALKDSIVRMAMATTSSQAYPEQTDLGEVGRIIDLLDTCCESALEDLLSFLKSPNGSLRLKKLAPFLQQLCYRVMLTIIQELETETDLLYESVQYGERSIELVHQSLFIGRLLLAIEKLSKQIPLILGSPELWLNKGATDISGTPRDLGGSSVPFGGSDSPDTLLENFKRLTRDLSIKAHDIWISWISNRLSEILFSNLMKDETAFLSVWDGTVAAEEHSAESPSEMKVSVPCMPSPYILIFLRSACEEVSRVGEHLLDGIIMQNLASKLSGKVTKTYGRYFLVNEMLSRDGVLQILLDLGFSADILSGGNFIGSKIVSGSLKVKTPYAGSRDKRHTKKAVGREIKDWLINGLVQRLDPVDWLKYEPYLVEIKRQSYLHHAVNLKVFVQLNPMYTEYLGFGVATPFLKSLIQVGSGCRSTPKLGSMLTNGQVGRSSVILHSRASGVLSSFTESRLYV